MKTVVLLLLLAIVASLASGLFFLTKKNDDPTRLLRSLQIRVVLSIMLVALLISAYFFGWIPPVPQ
ncbi:MAG: twin transmembrane helix small protein [Woeseiaceae bacterium]|nr:twin transmembrane helix small protein [Woeseiaceae bacterium]